MLKIQSLALTGAILIAGCSQMQDGQGQNDNENQNSNDNGDGGEATARALTTEEASAVASVARETEALGLASSAASYARETSLPNGRASIQQLIDCPTLTTEVDADSQQDTLTVDFQDGCTPTLYPDITFSGLLSGSIQTGPTTIELILDQLSAGGQAVTGQMTLSFEKTDTSIEFAISLSISSATGGSLTLDSATWAVDVETGIITINGSGTATDSDGGEYAVALNDLVINPAGNGNFIPQSGTIVMQFPDESGSFTSDSTTIVITFTDRSPVDGMILISINGFPAFEHQIAVPAL